MKLLCKSVFTIVALSSLFNGCTTDDEHNNLKKEFDDNKKELIILKKEFDEFKKIKSKSDEELSICKNETHSNNFEKDKIKKGFDTAQPDNP